MGIAEKIRELRERKGMSQRDLAKACGVTYQSIQYWERPDGGAPRHKRLETLASVLGVSVADLVQDSEERWPGVKEDARNLIDDLVLLAQAGRLAESDIYLLRDLVGRLTNQQKPVAHNRRKTDRESDWVIGGPKSRNSGKKKGGEQ